VIDVLFQTLHQFFVTAAGKIAAFLKALVVHHAAPVNLVNGRFRSRAAGTAPVAVKTGKRSKTPFAAWHLASPPWMVLLLPYRVSAKVIVRMLLWRKLFHHHAVQGLAAGGKTGRMKGQAGFPLQGRSVS
jgi:hypothetical protein